MTPLAMTAADEESAVALETQAVIERRELILDEIFASWRNGSTPDALAELEKHPELGRTRSVILELACEEYWQRADRGESPSIHEFIDRFPGCSTGLRRILSLGTEIDSTAPARPDRAEWPAIGTVYRGFRLQERLGFGAFSCVYLAQDTALGDRQVVLKLTTLPGNEPEALGKLEHDHVVPVYAYYEAETDDYAALVMPYYGRATLESLLDRLRVLPSLPESSKIIHDVVADGVPGNKTTRAAYVDSVLRLAHGLCQGLTAAHAKELLHLDIKPSNVLLADDGTLKLFDFNLTRVTGRDSCFKLGGTLPYMSPEQYDAALNGGEESLDARSDLFSLGIVLYELLTARHPFGPIDPAQPARATADLLRVRQQRGVQPLRELNPQVNPSCARLIESCLAYDPKDRPASARELAEKLQAELRLPAKFQRLKIRHPRGVLTAVAGIFLLLAAAAFGVSHHLDHGKRCRAQAEVAAREGRFPEAINLLTTALDFDPSDDASRLLRARCQAASNHYDFAVSDFEALAGSPVAAEARSGLIYCHVRRKNTKRAVETAAAGSVSQPLTVADLNNLACGYMQMTQMEKARPYLDQAISLAPEAVAPRLNRSYVEWVRSYSWPKYVPSTGIDDVLCLLSVAKTAKNIT